MEPDNQHLVDEYVQDFVLDHLETVTIKREEKRQTIEAETLLQSDYSSSISQWNERRMPSSPPETIFTQAPVLTNDTLLNDLGTPPDTPPNHSPLACRPSGIVEEMMWFPQSTRTEPQPLDLRPLHCMGGEPDWERREYIPSGMLVDGNIHHMMHQRPHSVCSGSTALSPCMNQSGYTSASSGDIGLDNDLLESLPVKELNKRLQGSPREDILKMKQKRRTLKNRGYARICRFKRLQQKQDLEETSRSLTHELQRIKAELATVTGERDLLRQKLQLGQRLRIDSGINVSMSNFNIDEQSSPEFYSYM